MSNLSWGAIMVFLYAGNALFYAIGIIRLILDRGNQKPLTEFPSVSIVVPARNEEDNLSSCLKALAEQNYSGKWDVWVVNDRSTDRTSQIAGDFAGKYNNFNLIEISENSIGVAPKKNAVIRGINSSSGEIILTTDADCVMRPGWIESMVRKFTPQTGMVMGIPVYRYKMRLLELFQALDYASISITAAGLAALGKPITCSAANLAYRRKTFEEVNGFETIAHFVSGDDDLLLQKIAKNGKWEISATAERESFVYTTPVDSWKKVLEQRARWGSKGTRYPLVWTRFYLAGLFLLMLFFILGWVILPGSAMVAVWAGKMAVDFIFSLLLVTVIGKWKIAAGFFPLSLGQPLLIVTAAVKGYFGKYKWK